GSALTGSECAAAALAADEVEEEAPSRSLGPTEPDAIEPWAAAAPWAPTCSAGISGNTSDWKPYATSTSPATMPADAARPAQFECKIRAVSPVSGCLPPSFS